MEPPLGFAPSYLVYRTSASLQMLWRHWLLPTESRAHSIGWTAGTCIRLARFTGEDITLYATAHI
jgi:hypothetical protein